MEQAETLQNLLISRATGGSESSVDFRQLRQALIEDPNSQKLLPKCVKTCRSLDQFWQFIKYKFDTYTERSSFLYAEFQPLLDHLEKGGNAAGDDSISIALGEFDSEHVQVAWAKALSRRETDPEGAITAARTLLESVCKHVLDDLGESYSESADLHKLYGKTAKALNLAPDQHNEEVFKKILGGCTSVVQGLGSLRNKLSDAHGKGRSRVKPAPRHAELAVNLSGSMASFLVAALMAKKAEEV